MTNPRRLLLVAPRPCNTELATELARQHWHWEQVPDLPSAGRLMVRQKFDVALLMLEHDLALAATQFYACAEKDPSCEWVGVFLSEADDRPPWRDHIIDNFFDHHVGPADAVLLCQSLGQAYGRAVLRSVAEAESANDEDSLGMVGESPALRELRVQVRKTGATDQPVLIGGPSGSGKELVARALHRCSRRAKGPFVAVNCGALSPTLIHSELFGHERGSFSGATAARRGLIEAARGGTLFLDEIAELPLELQATLLRFLQEKTVVRVGSEQVTEADTRVIAASHVDLAQAAAAGTFREDLYFRLSVLEIQVPPLRDRRDDIPLIARHFYQSSAGARPTASRGFSPAAMAAMVEYHWPGNVRELHNRVQRAVVMADQSLITPADLGLDATAASDVEGLQAARSRAESGAIRNTMQRVDRNVTLAALELGISRMTLYRLMTKHGISYDSA